jgi:hypothetical protein
MLVYRYGSGLNKSADPIRAAARGAQSISIAQSIQSYQIAIVGIGFCQHLQPQWLGRRYRLLFRSWIALGRHCRALSGISDSLP